MLKAARAEEDNATKNQSTAHCPTLVGYPGKDTD